MPTFGMASVLVIDLGKLAADEPPAFPLAVFLDRFALGRRHQASHKCLEAICFSNHLVSGSLKIVYESSRKSHDARRDQEQSPPQMRQNQQQYLLVREFGYVA